MLVIDVPGRTGTVAALGKTTSEKGFAGTASTRTGWDANSVFGLFDRCVRGKALPSGSAPLASEVKGFDVVVCDDMDSETCDFICADTINKRIVLVHGKWKKSKLSASAFHDVCSQAVKNLDILQPFADRVPPNLASWSSDWTASYGQDGSIGVVPRVRRSKSRSSDGQTCWANIRDLIRQPNASREVWLLLGRTIDVSALRAEQRKPKPSPEAVQIYYQLQSTWAAVSAVGARLRVFAA